MSSMPPEKEAKPTPPADQKGRAEGTPRPPGENDRGCALERLMDLLSISATTGEEKPVCEYLLAELARIGIPGSAIVIDDAPSRIDLPCQTGNLIVQVPGTARRPRRLFVAHMDTVPLAKNAEPVVRGDRIVAMGKTALGGDDRSGIAALLTALDELLRGDLPHPPLTFLFSIREETGLRGTSSVHPRDLGEPALAFNFDGGDPAEVTIGATGAMRLEIEVKGLAAHAGAHPERGVSAVAIFAGAVVELDRNGWLGRIRKAGGAGSSNIGFVQGGEATNVITDLVRAHAEARSHDPEFLQRIVEEYRRAFSTSAASHHNESGKCGEAEIHAEESYASFALPQDAPVVQAALAAARAIGLDPRTRISDGGLDANWLIRRGIPTVSLGCGQHEIHTTNEYILVEEFFAACRLALELAKG